MSPVIWASTVWPRSCPRLSQLSCPLSLSTSMFTQPGETRGNNFITCCICLPGAPPHAPPSLTLVFTLLVFSIFLLPPLPFLKSALTEASSTSAALSPALRPGHCRAGWNWREAVGTGRNRLWNLTEPALHQGRPAQGEGKSAQTRVSWGAEKKPQGGFVYFKSPAMWGGLLVWDWLGSLLMELCWQIVW